jgi:hypothetical protein
VEADGEGTVGGGAGVPGTFDVGELGDGVGDRDSGETIGGETIPPGVVDALAASALGGGLSPAQADQPQSRQHVTTTVVRAAAGSRIASLGIGKRSRRQGCAKVPKAIVLHELNSFTQFLCESNRICQACFTTVKIRGLDLQDMCSQPESLRAVRLAGWKPAHAGLARTGTPRQETWAGSHAPI